MTWAQRLKRVFNIVIAQCEKCQKHNVTIIACITQPDIIHKILLYLDKQVKMVDTLEPKGNVGRRVIFGWTRMANNPDRSIAGT
jgi:hypothetical protein